MRLGEINLLNLEFPLILRASAPLGDEELIRFSEENKPYKIERNRQGELVIMTPGGYTGGRHEIYVASALVQWSERDGRGSAVGPNIGFNLPDGSCLAPDAAWIAKARVDALTPEQQAGFPPLCPDFILEVRSQSDSRRSVQAKMQLWLENGAQLAWLVDPIDGNVTIYRPGQAAELLEQPEVVRGEGPIAGFELPCTRLWPAG